MIEVAIQEITLPVVSLLSVTLTVVTGGNGATVAIHEHDNIANWLWDDGSCILWDDNTVIAL